MTFTAISEAFTTAGIGSLTCFFIWKKKVIFGEIYECSTKALYQYVRIFEYCDFGINITIVTLSTCSLSSFLPSGASDKQVKA